MANSSVRTAAELSKIEFNYFEAFKIKPEETDGDVIAKKINAMCLKMANGSDPVNVRLGKDLKADAIEVMQFDAIYDPNTGSYRRNAGGRKREAEACRRMRADRAIAFIRTLGNRGVLYVSEIQKIVQKNGIDMGDIESQLKTLESGGLEIADDTQNVAAPYPAADGDDISLQKLTDIVAGFMNGTDDNIYNFGCYSEVEKCLAVCTDGVKDLFSFLGISADVSAAEAQSTLQNSQADNIANTTKKSAEGIALKLVYGYGQRIFDGNEAHLKAYKKYVITRDEVFIPLSAYYKNGIYNIRKRELLHYISILTGILGENEEQAAQYLAYILKYVRLAIL